MMPAIISEIGVSARGVAAAVIALSVFIAPGPAGAVSAKVKFACARDYLAHCRQFRPDTPEVRQCMNAIGERLSSRCVSALVAAGEVTEREVALRAANARN